MKTKLLLIIIFTITNIIYTQHSELYLSKEYKNALEKRTRSLDGQPGENYWINRTDYKIDVNFNPFTKNLDGTEKLTYFNHSPDTLKRLVIRVYQDFYKKGNARDWQINPEQLNDGVFISKIKINNTVLDIDDENIVKRTGTNLIILLPQSEFINPGSKTVLEIEFSYIFPNFPALRMGSYDSTSVFVAHWYPQMAVYDDIDGWDYNNYYGTYEFYNDFGNFEVNIRVPKNFIVWGTGKLKNYKEVLSPVSAYRYELSEKRNDIINIITKKDLAKGNFTRQRDFNTWKFKAKMVPDFAFGTSDHYLWDRTSVVVDKVMERRVSIDAAYKDESIGFKSAVEIGRKSVKYFSEELPGIPYPWPEMSLFNGGGGMEFPMMVNLGSYEWDRMVGIISHEIAHTYMPFYLGTNERKYAFMDEGWAVMLPFDFQAREMIKLDPIARNNIEYESAAGKELDVPLMISSILSRGWSYRNLAYSKPGATYYILKDIMGEVKFKRALKQYSRLWSGKHPIPYDFFFTFEEVYGESLEWFWKPWFFEFGVPDLAIDHVNENVIFIKKIGKLPVPINLEVIYTNGETEIIKYSADVWKNENMISVRSKYRTPIKKIILGNDHIPDIDKSDNFK